LFARPFAHRSPFRAAVRRAAFPDLASARFAVALPCGCLSDFQPGLLSRFLFDARRFVAGSAPGRNQSEAEAKSGQAGSRASF